MKYIYSLFIPLLGILYTGNASSDTNEDELNSYVVQIINQHLDTGESFYLRDGNKPVFRFAIPGKDFGGCTVNHKLKDSSYLDIHLKTPTGLKINLDTEYRRPYFAKEFTLPIDLDGKLDMVTRTGVKVAGHCSNYTKDNWYYSLSLEPELKVMLLMILDPHLVYTPHGQAIKLTPQVKLSAHLNNFDENDISINAHGQDWGWVWTVLDLSNRFSKASLTTPSKFVDSFKKNINSSAISLLSFFESGGLFSTSEVLIAFGLLDKLNEELVTVNSDYAKQIEEMQDNINEKLQISLRKYRLWAEEAGEPNPNTIYIPINPLINNVPEPKPLKATLIGDATACDRGQQSNIVSFSSIDATYYNVSQKNQWGKWIPIYTGSQKYYNFKSDGTQSLNLVSRGCNSAGCGPASDMLTISVKNCSGGVFDF